MEQKTEASQAVDDLLPCPFCGFPASLKSVNDWHSVEVDHDGNCPLAWSGASLRANSVDAKWITSVWNRRAALKAQPAPTEAQGEDSARLDAERYRFLNDLGATFYINGEKFHVCENAMDEAIDRARASAETGGVKS